MANPALKGFSRAQVDRYLQRERKLRRSGIWGEWERLEFPDGIMSRKGWLGEIRAAFRNQVFSVLFRPTPNGEVHLAISSLSGDRPTWHEMQRIKNDILGEDATAVEVYPPQSEVVDEADMFHLWSHGPMPFSIFSGRSNPSPTPPDYI